MWQPCTHACTAREVCFLLQLIRAFGYIREKGFVSSLGRAPYFILFPTVFSPLFLFFTLYFRTCGSHCGCTRAFACTLARNPKCYSTGIIRPSIATKLPFELIRVSTTAQRHYRTTDAAIYLEIVTMPFSSDRCPVRGIRPAPIVDEGWRRPSSPRLMCVHH